ncbi:MAG: 50S ribosomal protein L9 [Candidatus Terrybacteria bacterium]|nr:50S ribosomal protein L9 [Candidatus Terrybacteria bacterium]
MKIILLQDVPNAGRKYEIKNVSDGYARNFLFPRKLAEIAAPKSIQAMEIKRKQLEQKKQIQQDLFEKNLESLNGAKVVIKEKTNEKGHLFAAIHPKEISRAIKEQHHIDIPPEMIELDKPIKEKGEYKIKIKDREFKVIV